MPHPTPCLPANYPGFGAQSAPKMLTRSKWSNGAKSLSRLHSNKVSSYPVTIVTDHSALLFHCINIHIDITCNDGSIKRGAARSQICQVSFQIRRHGPVALHATFKIKSAKGLRNPDLFQRDLCLCACLVFCHVFLINARQLANTPLVTFSYRFREGLVLNMAQRYCADKSRSLEVLIFLIGMRHRKRICERPLFANRK